MMAYLDLTSGWRVLQCDEDRRPFVSRAYQARYCSLRCQARAIKRAHRERLRARGAEDGAGSDADDTAEQSSA